MNISHINHGKCNVHDINPVKLCPIDIYIYHILCSFWASDWLIELCKVPVTFNANHGISRTGLVLQTVVVPCDT